MFTGKYEHTSGRTQHALQLVSTNFYSWARNQRNRSHRKNLMFLVALEPTILRCLDVELTGSKIPFSHIFS